MEILKPFHSCEMSVRDCEMALMCQRVVSQLWKTLRNCVSAAKWRIFKVWKACNHFAVAKLVYLAAKWHSYAKGPLHSCENFRRGGWTATKPFRSGRRFSQRLTFAAKFRRPCSFLAFELLLIPKFLLSPLLTFLLILIIQKSILHQNKLKLKHWNQN